MQMGIAFVGTLSPVSGRVMNPLMEQVIPAVGKEVPPGVQQEAVEGLPADMAMEQVLELIPRGER